jgi:SHS2 domain-containing protein
VDWLNELLFLFETERLLVARAAVSLDAPAAVSLDAPAAVSLDRRAVSLRAGVHGERHDPARHGLKVLVKAVTYHGLAIERAAEGYVATVIFDI